MKRIARFVIALAAVAVFCPAVAQNNLGKADDFGRLALSVYLDRGKTQLPSAAYNILQNKMQTIVAKNGIGAVANQRFIMTANCNLLTKDITPTAPPMHAYTVEVTFYIGDGIEGTLFSTTSVTAKGVGETPDKAYIAALKAVKPNDPAYADFIETGKNKIIEYYNSKCDFLLANAESTAKTENYDDAIYQLMSIPEICKDCYMKAQSKVEGYYQSKIDAECAQLLTEARSAWTGRGSGDETRASAMRASEALSMVNPKASCYKEALGLMKEIGKKMEEIDKREWNMLVKMEEHAHEAEMANIKATRDVAMAYAKNQPKTVYKIYWW